MEFIFQALCRLSRFASLFCLVHGEAHGSGLVEHDVTAMILSCLTVVYRLNFSSQASL